MDLSEYHDHQGGRHPWELARIDAVTAILAPHLFDGIRILDLGCGDGFVCRELFSRGEGSEITGVDIYLTEERIRELQALPGAVSYLREPPKQAAFDLLLMMDVLEHVPDDLDFLGSNIDEHVAPGGKVLLTVPAFQFLYGHHDIVLGHHRRYRLAGLEQLAEAAGAKVLASGYLFGSLLLAKLVYNRLCESGGCAAGVGTWRRGEVVTALIQRLLRLDNGILSLAGRCGIKLPGLSAWALCEKNSRRSLASTG